jgi:hypothetical protein
MTRRLAGDSLCGATAQECTQLRSLTLRHVGAEACILAAVPSRLVAQLAEHCRLLAFLCLDGCDVSPRTFEVRDAARALHACSSIPC